MHCGLLSQRQHEGRHKRAPVTRSWRRQFLNFRCHDNRGPADVNLSDTGKLLDLENPLFGATFAALSLLLAEY